MGGFTVIYLKDRSEANIKLQNENLRKFGVPKKHCFYSFGLVEKEYQHYLNRDGNYPEHSFPSDKIKSFDDFLKYWNPDAIGEIFCPYTGSLQLDCYFGRTSGYAMRNIGKYIVEHNKDILAVGGTFDTFMERGMTKWEQKYIREKIELREIKYTYKVQAMYDSPYYSIYEYQK